MPGQFVEALAGPPRDLIERVGIEDVTVAIEVAAHRAILAERMYTSRAVAEAVGSGARNTSQASLDLRTSGAIVGMKSGTKFIHPAFQFDLQHRRVHPVVVEVNQALGAKEDPWGVASWWVSPNPRLAGKAPKDLIGTPAEGDLLVLARGETAE